MPVAQGQVAAEAQAAPPAAAEVAPPTGRQAFRGLRRQLTDDELKSPGTHKLMLDQLDRADADCDRLQAYVERFHEADKRAAVLDEKLRTQTAIDVAFGVGVGLGGTLVGAAPLVWSHQPAGYIALGLGLLLIGGAIAVKVIKR